MLRNMSKACKVPFLTEKNDLNSWYFSPSEHYPMVGECLLTALKEVLGDAASDEIMQGWKEGYEFLADLLIGIEDNLKKENANKKGKLIGLFK